MKLYAVIDTNVLVSALLALTPETPPYQVLSHLLNGDFTPILNEDILSEYSNVLKRKKKYQFDDELIDTLISQIQEKGIFASRSGNHEGVIDEKDFVFYEIAMSVEGSLLVTGNIKHYPFTPIVVTPREFWRYYKM